VPEDTAGAPCPLKMDVSATVSLAQAVDLALCNNAQIRAAWETIRVQAAAVGEAKAAYWPTLAVTATELTDRTAYSANIPTTTHTDPTVYAALAWRLFDFGGRTATREEAQALLEEAMAARDATIQKVLGSTVQAYFNAVTAKALVNDKTEDESLARNTLASAQRMQNEGAGAQNDTLAAAAAAAKTSLDLNRAIGGYEKAQAMLIYVLGLPPRTPIQLNEDLGTRTGVEEQDLSHWLEETQQHHPAIVAARKALQAAQYDVTVARSSGRPTIDLGANYYQNGYPQQGLTPTNTQVTTVGLSITVPLFDGWLTHYKVQSAQSEIKVKEANLEDTEQSTLAAVIEAYSDAQAAYRNLRASQDLLEAATASLESSQRRYGNGASGILELLTAQEMLADARNQRTQSLADWGSARLNLLASAGAMNRLAAEQP
jgi:outer membrane protein